MCWETEKFKIRPGCWMTNTSNKITFAALISLSFVEGETKRMLTEHRFPNALDTRYFFKTFLMLPVVISLYVEIPDFLSEEECDHIITLAKESGLQTSTSGYFTYDGDLDEELALAGELDLELRKMTKTIFRV